MDLQDTMMRIYTQAEVTGEDKQWLDGTSDRLVHLRFRTLDLTDGGDTESVTDWVTFTLPALEHLSVQLAAAVETIRRWTPGTAPDTVGLNLNMTARSLSS